MQKLGIADKTRYKLALSIIIAANALRDNYKARGVRPPSALFRMKQEQGNGFTILKNFQRNTLIKTCLLVPCNLIVERISVRQIIIVFCLRFLQCIYIYV